MFSSYVFSCQVYNTWGFWLLNPYREQCLPEIKQYYTIKTILQNQMFHFQKQIYCDILQ